MKKFLFLTVMSLIIIMFSFDEIKAQDEPCLPDCPNSGWLPIYPNPATEIDIVLCGITFHVRYRWRVACNTWYDYYLETVGADNTSDIRNCVNQYGGLNNFLEAVMEQLLLLNPVGFPPKNQGECNANWRVMKGNCWLVDWVSGIPSPQYEQGGLDPYMYGYTELALPCNTTDCCLDLYTVCINQNGEREITQTGYVPPSDPNCTLWPYPEPWECQPVCGY